MCAKATVVTTPPHVFVPFLTLPSPPLTSASACSGADAKMAESSSAGVFNSILVMVVSVLVFMWLLRTVVRIR